MNKLRLVFVAFVAMAIVSLYSCKGNKGGESSESDTMSVPGDYDSYLGDAYPELDDDSSLNQSEPIMVEDKEGNLSPEVVETPKSDEVIYIVAGSFTNYANAQQLNQKLKARGFDSKILEPYGHFNRVTVKEFASRDEARAALPSLRAQVKDQTLWILKR